MAGLRLTFILTTALFLMAFSISRSFQGQALTVLAFPGALNSAVIRDFEVSTGAILAVQTYQSNLALIALLEAENPPKFDVLLGTEGIILPLVHRNVLSPLDLNRLPNSRHLDGDYAQGPRGLFSVPIVSGVTGLAYRRDKLRFPPKSWVELLDHEAAWAGEVWLLRDRRLALGVALKALHRSANEGEPQIVTQAGRWLEGRSDVLRGFESTTHLEHLQKGEGLLAQAHLEDVLALNDRRVGFFVPQEGGLLYNDVAALSVNGEGAELAYLFVDHLLHPRNAWRLSQSLGRPSPSRGARRLGGAALGPKMPHLAALLNESILPVGKTALAFDVAWERLLRVVEGGR